MKKDREIIKNLAFFTENNAKSGKVTVILAGPPASGKTTFISNMHQLLKKEDFKYFSMHMPGFRGIVFLYSLFIAIIIYCRNMFSFNTFIKLVKHQKLHPLSLLPFHFRGKLLILLELFDFYIRMFFAIVILKIYKDNVLLFIDEGFINTSIHYIDAFRLKRANNWKFLTRMITRLFLLIIKNSRVVIYVLTNEKDKLLIRQLKRGDFIGKPNLRHLFIFERLLPKVLQLYIYLIKENSSNLDIYIGN